MSLTFLKGGISKVFSFPFKTRDRNGNNYHLLCLLFLLDPSAQCRFIHLSVRDSPETVFISYNCLAIGGHTKLFRCRDSFLSPQFPGMKASLLFYISPTRTWQLYLQAWDFVFRDSCGQWRDVNNGRPAETHEDHQPGR